MTTIPPTTEPEAAEEPQRFLCMAGHSARLREAGSVAMDRAWTVRAHDEKRFAITPFTRPRWLQQGVMVDVEIRHEEGREAFTTAVSEVVADEEETVWIWLHQPLSTEHVDLRRAPRADLSAEVTWAELDDEQHPGPDREAELTSLSTSGMRMRLQERPFPARHGLIVCSLHLMVARVNVLGTVVGVSGDDDTQLGDVRVAFQNVNDETTAVLDAEVKRLLELPVDLRREPIVPWSREHRVAMARATYGEVERWQR